MKKLLWLGPFVVMGALWRTAFACDWLGREHWAHFPAAMTAVGVSFAGVVATAAGLASTSTD